jgi:DNA invertase Pin-like site-specific DNA recombinase
MKTAVGYIRVSKVNGRGGDSFISPDLQRKSIERVCAREGLTLIDTLVELDESGADNKRPLWNQAIEAVESRQYDAFVCWNLSRFSRSTVDALKATERIESNGGDLFSEEGVVGKFGRTVFFAMAEEERDQKTRGFLNARASSVERGIHAGTKAGTFGYLRDPDTRRFVPDPKNGHKVKEMMEMRKEGVSYPKIAKAFGLRGGSSARQIITNRVCLGEARSGEFVNPNAHPPLVSELLFEQRASPRRRAGCRAEAPGGRSSSDAPARSG